MDGGAWWAAVHGVAKSRTQLSDFTFTFHCHALEKEMATHSSVLAWRIPGTGEPGGLLSMGSHRVRHDWSDLAAAAAGLAWWAAVYGVAQSWTRLKWCSSSSSSRIVPNALSQRIKQLHFLPRVVQIHMIADTIFLKILKAWTWGHSFNPWLGKIPHAVNT